MNQRPLGPKRRVGVGRVSDHGDVLGGENNEGLSGSTTFQTSNSATSLNGGRNVPGALTMPDSVEGVGAVIVCTFIDEPLPLESGGAPGTYGTCHSKFVGVVPDVDDDFDKADECLSSATSGDYLLGLSVATPTDRTSAGFQFFPGNVADPRPTGPVTAGEGDDHSEEVSSFEANICVDLGSRGGDAVSGDVLSFTGGSSAQTTITQAASVVVRSDTDGDGLVNAVTSPEPANCPHRSDHRLLTDGGPGFADDDGFRGESTKTRLSVCPSLAPRLLG